MATYPCSPLLSLNYILILLQFIFEWPLPVSA